MFSFDFINKSSKELILKSIAALTTQSDQVSGQNNNMAALLLSITFNMVSLEKCHLDDNKSVGALKKMKTLNTVRA